MSDEKNKPPVKEADEQEGDEIIEPPPNSPTDARPPEEGSQGSSIKGVAPPPDDRAKRA